MCGILFVHHHTNKVITKDIFFKALDSQKWRGPDSQNSYFSNDMKFLMGHNRLAIIDPSSKANQPMFSKDGRYAIIYNGEIYNHKEIRKNLDIKCATDSDTETILEGYSKIGDEIFNILDGMFALIIVDFKNGTWVAARDPFGIKPLFYATDAHGNFFLGSESSVLAKLIKSKPCFDAIAEWKIIRRPLPGKSFFELVNELLPGHLLKSDSSSEKYWTLIPSKESFSQSKFEEILIESVKMHELSDVKNVSLLSGGLDSAVIAKLSSVKKTYCVGLNGNNEFQGAKETAKNIDKKIDLISLDSGQLKMLWVELSKLKGEPISLPNEGLIYLVCNSMDKSEKVVLTGEGADEILFGYDNIFRWAIGNEWPGADVFLKKYGYSDNTAVTSRLREYIENLKLNKSNIEFVEDFFFQVHLPGLLRRMDFAAMAASKEARVPFVTKKVVEYMYRRSANIKIDENLSKIPLRNFAKKLGLNGALNRRKIGFSAQINNSRSRFDEYADFQHIVLGALNW